MDGGAAMDEERLDFRGVVGWEELEPERMPERAGGLLLIVFSCAVFSPEDLVRGLGLLVGFFDLRVVVRAPIFFR